MTGTQVDRRLVLRRTESGVQTDGRWAFRWTESGVQADGRWALRWTESGVQENRRWALRWTEFGVQTDGRLRSGGQKSGAAATVAAAPEDTLIKRVMYWRTAHLSELPKEERRHTGKMRERKARMYVSSTLGGAQACGQNEKCASCSPSKRPLKRC